MSEQEIAEEAIGDEAISGEATSGEATSGESGDPADDLSRPQKRLLKRLYNARTVPVIADDRPFLTYKDALRYLLSLSADAREAAYAQMKAHVREKVR